MNRKPIKSMKIIRTQNLLAVALVGALAFASGCSTCSTIETIIRPVFR